MIVTSESIGDEISEVQCWYIAPMIINRADIDTKLFMLWAAFEITCTPYKGVVDDHILFEKDYNELLEYARYYRYYEQEIY